jgi:hypothetical protein
MTGAKAVLVALAAILLAVTAVRNAAVDAWSPLRPELAASVWNGHPQAELSLGMLEIAEAMRERRAVDDSVFKTIDDAATKAPLKAEPFLVRGVHAQILGKQQLALQSFLAAQYRDPRSLPAAYFLADHYFRSGDAAHGMKQVGALARLSPGGAQLVAPYLAAYARDRSNWPLLKQLFQSEPKLEDAALQSMANDPGNAEAVLALAGANRRGPAASWLNTLVARLVQTGQYGKAHAIWASVSHVRPGANEWLFDSGFAQSAPPPPFNWQLVSSAVGLAERRPGGRLHVIYYGQEEGPLASQLVLLPAGSYRLSLRLLPGSIRPEALVWSIKCDKAEQELSRIGLDAAAKAGWTFTVPPGCPAQHLELWGTSSDMPQQSDVAIAALRLIRGGGGV